jgi:hypothetical protein
MVNASSVPFRLAFHIPFGSGMFECFRRSPARGVSMALKKGTCRDKRVASYIIPAQRNACLQSKPPYHKDAGSITARHIRIPVQSRETSRPPSLSRRRSFLGYCGARTRFDGVRVGRKLRRRFGYSKKTCSAVIALAMHQASPKCLQHSLRPRTSTIEKSKWCRQRGRDAAAESEVAGRDVSGCVVP